MGTAHAENHTSERLIRIEEVKRLTGLSTATLYRKMAARDFPLPVRLGAVARAWPLSEVQDWIAKRMALRGTHECADGCASADCGGAAT